MRRVWRGLMLCSFSWLLAAGGTVVAAPYLPTADEQVLERLPLAATDAAVRETRALRRQLASEPHRLDLAVQVARRYTELGRVKGDPRYAGYAQATLANWWELPVPPSEVLLIRATLRQRAHDFAAALADLALLLERNPRDGQARLTRATILQVQGDYAAVARECAALRRLAGEIVWAACAHGLGSVNGSLRASYAALRDLLARQTAAAPEIRVWVLSMLAEMAARADLHDAAESHFRDALAIDPTDHYLLSAYADWLLEQRRPAQVIDLLGRQQRTDALLLRQALALQALRSAELAARVDQLRTRFAASRLRGDRAHLREEARFALELLGDPATALALARENWAVQKEVPDLRLLLQAALANGDRAAVGEVRQWLASRRTEDVAISRLLGQERT